MSPGPTDLLIAAYLYFDPAKLDFEAVVDAGVAIEGAVCVSRDDAGELHVEEKDHLARGDPEVLGGAGLAVALFAPPLLLATAAGAAIGGGLGELVDHELEDKIKEHAGETIALGGAGLIVAYPRSSADGIDKAITRTTKKEVREVDNRKVDALKKALAEAQGRMQQPTGSAAGNTP